MAAIFVGDIGTIIEIQITENNVPVDLTAVADIWLIFTKPDKTVITKKKTLGELTISDPTNGKFVFTATSGFWSMSGTWSVYPVIKFSIGISEYTGTLIQWGVQVGGSV